MSLKQTLIDDGEAFLLSKDSFCIEPSNPQSLAKILARLETPIAQFPAAMAGLECPQWIALNKLKKVDSSNAGDYIVRAQTGSTFGELDTHLLPYKQMFPLRYPADMTLAQILAEDRPALESGTQGYPRDYVLKSEIATVDGKLTYSGADVVKNVTGYDLHKFYVGSRNAFGILTEVTLKLIARPEAIQNLQAHCNTVAEAIILVNEVRTSLLNPIVFELVQTLNGWGLFLQIQGAKAFLENSIHSWHTKAASAWKIDPLQSEFTPDSIQASLDALRSWTNNHAVLEIVTPLSDFDACLEALNTLIQACTYRRNDVSQLSEENLLSEKRRVEPAFIQARPLAGLIYLAAQPEIFESLGSEIQNLLATYPQTFIQWAHWPETVYTALVNQQPFWTDARRWNLPQNPLQHNLLKNLKKRYDPENILWTPELEL